MSDNVEQAAINTQNGNAWWADKGQDPRQVGHTGLMNRYDAQKKAGLLFKVEKEKVMRNGQAVPRAFYTVRTDTDAVLGIVGNVWQPIQNDTLFDVLADVTGDSEAVYESAGSLSGGRKVWALAQLPKEYVVKPGDWIRTYLLMAIGHDGSMPLILSGTDIRVVCENTMNQALKRGKSDPMSHMQVVYHTTNAKEYVARAKHMMGLIMSSGSLFANAARTLADTPMTEKYLEHYVQILFPSKADVLGKEPRANVERQRDAIRTGFESDINNIGQQHTAWSAYQAVTDFVDHGKSSRQTVDRLDWSWFGDGIKLRNKAFNWLMDYPVAGREPELAKNDPWDQLTI